MSLKALFCVELLPSAMDSNLNEFWILFAHSSCTSLFILLFISPQYTVLHILFLIFTYIYIYSLVLCFIFLHCPLSGPVLIYISLLIISCIIEYVMNKRNLNLKVDSLTAEPKPPLLIKKRHFRDSNEGMLSCLIKSLLYYCIKSSVLCAVEYYERVKQMLY